MFNWLLINILHVYLVTHRSEGGGGATTRTGVSFSLTRARAGVGAAPEFEFLEGTWLVSPPARRGALFAKSAEFSDFL